MTSISTTMPSIAGIKVPDSKLARAVTELVRDTETPLLFHHSSRVYYFGALAGKRRGLKFDPELLYTGAMFHDMGLMPSHSSADERFEVDGANAARDFPRSHGRQERYSVSVNRRLRPLPSPDDAQLYACEPTSREVACSPRLTSWPQTDGLTISNAAVSSGRCASTMAGGGASTSRQTGFSRSRGLVLCQIPITRPRNIGRDIVAGRTFNERGGRA
jgi:hypothetical protein